MPYLNGVWVSNDEWIAAKNAEHGITGPITWKQAMGWKDPEPEGAPVAPEQPSPDEVPEPKRRDRNKKAQAEAAIAAVTGLDIDIDQPAFVEKFVRE